MLASSGRSPLAETTNVVEGVREQVGEITRKLQAKKEAVQGWCRQQRLHADETERAALGRLEDVKERLAQLKAEHHRLESMGYANEIRMRAEKQKVSDLQGVLSELRSEEAAVAHAMDQASSRRSAILKTASSAQLAIDQETEKHEYQNNQLTRGALLYRKLGLDFEKVTQNRLKLRFDQIDPHNPSREFFFVVFIDGSDQYHVEQVEPSVGPIDHLLDQLNADNNFSRFVRSMRCKFQALCA